MSDNPYQSPRTSAEAIGVLSGSRQDVRAVAIYQKGILVCILINLLAVLGLMLRPVEVPAAVGLVFLALWITGAVFVLLLAIKVYGVALGIVLFLLTVVPLIGLFVMLMVNGKATRILRQNGIRVGLLGARLSDI